MNDKLPILPLITIGEKVVFMPIPKARLWREIIKFDTERKDISSADFIDAHCGIIALAFGITKDEVLDNLDVDKVLPLYLDILTYVVASLTDRIVEDKKNSTETIETQV